MDRDRDPGGNPRSCQKLIEKRHAWAMKSRILPVGFESSFDAKKAAAREGFEFEDPGDASSNVVCYACVALEGHATSCFQPGISCQLHGRMQAQPRVGLTHYTRQWSYATYREEAFLTRDVLSGGGRASSSQRRRSLKAASFAGPAIDRSWIPFTSAYKPFPELPPPKARGERAAEEPENTQRTEG